MNYSEREVIENSREIIFIPIEKYTDFTDEAFKFYLAGINWENAIKQSIGMKEITNT